MRKVYLYSFLIFLIIILINGCSLFEKADIKLYKEGSVRFYFTSLDPYQAAFAGEDSGYHVKVENQFPALGEPDVQQIIINKIIISKDGQNWVTILDKKTSIDLNDDLSRDYRKGYPVGIWQGVPEGIYPYAKIYFSDVIVGRKSLKYDSIIQDIREKGLELNPLELNPQNSPAIRIYPEENNCVYFNFYLDEVLAEDGVKQKYTVSGKPAYSLKPENSQNNIQVKGTISYISQNQISLLYPRYVALYKEKNDYLENKSPLFGSFADYKEEFTFSNIPAGKYYLGAYIDMNGNDLYDPEIDYGLLNGAQELTVETDEAVEINLELQKNVAPVPSELSVKDKTAHSVTLEWTQNVNSDFFKYVLYQLPAPYTQIKDDFQIATIETQTTTTYQVDNLSYETSYYFVLRTYDYSGAHSDSNLVTATTDSVLQLQATYDLTFEAYGLGKSYDQTTLLVTSLHHYQSSEAWIFRLDASDFHVTDLTYESPAYYPFSFVYDGHYYFVTDFSNRVIKRANSAFHLNGTVDCEQFRASLFNNPGGITHDYNSNTFYVSDYNHKKIYAYSYSEAANRFTLVKSYTFPAGDDGSISDFTMVDGELWSCDPGTKKIYRHNPDLSVKESYPFNYGVPTGIEYLNNNLYIIDSDQNRLLSFKIVH